MKGSDSVFKRHRFPPEVIQHAVWLDHRFNLSARDVEDLLAERGIAVSYESIRPRSAFSKASYANNRAELSHQPTRVRERGMRRLASLQDQANSMAEA